MKFVALVYLEDEKLRAVPDSECMDSGNRLRAAGKLVAAEALQPIKTAKTVRVRQGEVRIVDGPFAETKELLAGFYLFDAKDMDEALALAKPSRTTLGIRLLCFPGAFDPRPKPKA